MRTSRFLPLTPCLLAVALSTSALAAPPKATSTAAPIGTSKIIAESNPRAFLEVIVAGVVPSGDGHTLVLVSPAEQVLLPVGIGLSEALTLHARLENRRFARPMTHDLLEHVVAELGGEVVRVQIDDLRDDVFVGSVIIRTRGKLVSIDARPSDAVALALGARAPIFVSRPVVDRAALHPGDFQKGDGERGPPPAPAEPGRPATGEGVLAL